MKISEAKLKNIVRRVLRENRDPYLIFQDKVYPLVDKIVRFSKSVNLDSYDYYELSEMYRTYGESNAEINLVQNLRKLVKLTMNVTRYVNIVNVIELIKHELIEEGCSRRCANNIVRLVEDAVDGAI